MSSVLFRGSCRDFLASGILEDVSRRRLPGCVILTATFDIEENTYLLNTLSENIDVRARCESAWAGCLDEWDVEVVREMTFWGVEVLLISNMGPGYGYTVPVAYVA